MATKNKIGLDQELVKPIIEGLDKLLSDYQIFYTNLRGLHWEIKGDKFFELHALYEEYYDEAAEVIDEIAERIIMLGGHPENRFSAYLKTSDIKETHGISDWEKGVKNLLESITLILQKCRDIQVLAMKAGDISTASFTRHRIGKIEKNIWMLSAYMA